jgi:hypothetical protein
MAATNEQFLEGLEKDYPDVDWDNLPDTETAPDVWIIDGWEHERTVFLKHKDRDERERKRTIAFSISHEYTSYEEAAAKLQSMKTDPLWCEEKLTDDNSDGPVPFIKHMGPVIFERTTIRKTKPRESLNLYVMKELREKVLAGKKVFPMYLP